MDSIVRLAIYIVAVVVVGIAALCVLGLIGAIGGSIANEFTAERRAYRRAYRAREWARTKDWRNWSGGDWFGAILVTWFCILPLGIFVIVLAWWGLGWLWAHL